MKLIGSKTSPYVRKVRIVLIEKHIPCEFVEENVWNADSTVPKFNPLNKVPALVLDDGTLLFDSPVITEYLDAISPLNRLIPDAARERALTKRWEALGDGIADAGVALFLERKEAQPDLEHPLMRRQRARIEAAIAYAARELGDRKHCQQELFNYADIGLYCALAWIEFRLKDLFDWRQDYANLAAWAERVEHRASIAETKPPAS
jgi:glutathione S-transferase